MSADVMSVGDEPANDGPMTILQPFLKPHQSSGQRVLELKMERHQSSAHMGQSCAGELVENVDLKLDTMCIPTTKLCG